MTAVTISSCNNSDNKTRTAQTTTDNQIKRDSTSGYASVNGLKMYYEIHGTGAPLVLIHGNGGNIAFMKSQIEYFSRKYQVVVMDCRGRGKSELGNDSLTYMQMTKDIAGILDYLKLDSAYIVGRSDGGIISLLLAIYYPQKVNKVVAFAANLSPDTTSLYPSFYNEVKRERKQADEMLAKNDTSRAERRPGLLFPAGYQENPGPYCP